MEPEGKNLSECLTSRQRLWSNPPQFLNTIAEGIMTQQVKYFCSFNSQIFFSDQVGQLTFPILCDLVDGVVTVTDQEMAEGCWIVAERMKVSRMS